MRIKEFGVAVLGRWSGAWREVLASTIGAVAAWEVAQRVFGHEHPIFAAVIAIVCLAPGLPNHTKQALALILGVTTGVLVSELMSLVPYAMLRMACGVFFAMMVASSFELGAVVPIQAGVSVLLVFVLGPETAGYIRVVDVIIGAVVGLALSQVLPKPTTSS